MVSMHAGSGGSKAALDVKPKQVAVPFKEPQAGLGQAYLDRKAASRQLQFDSSMSGSASAAPAAAATALAGVGESGLSAKSQNDRRYGVWSCCKSVCMLHDAKPALRACLCCTSRLRQCTTLGRVCGSVSQCTSFLQYPHSCPVSCLQPTTTKPLSLLEQHLPPSGQQQNMLQQKPTCSNAPACAYSSRLMDDLQGDHKPLLPQNLQSLQPLCTLTQQQLRTVSWPLMTMQAACALPALMLTGTPSSPPVATLPCAGKSCTHTPQSHSAVLNVQLFSQGCKR